MSEYDDPRQDPQYEPSYYEIALTHRQVLFGFVILLGCLMATFFAGIWMGRGGETAQAATVVPIEEGGTVADSSLPQVNFFSEEEGAANGTAPSQAASTSPAAAAPAATEPLRTTDGRTPDELNEEAKRKRRERIRRRREAEEQAAVAEKTSAVPEPIVITPQATKPAQTKPQPAQPQQSKPQQSKPAQAEPKAPTPTVREPKPVAPTAETADRFVIQVLSTRDRGKANEVVARLQGGGYRTSMSTVEQGEQVMYRVRVGPYGNRADADSAANTVRRTFKLDTWVTAE